MIDDALTQRVRDYYKAKGWPDELWAMGFDEAVAFAEHFTEAERSRCAAICVEGANKHDAQEGGALLATIADLIRNPVE